MIEAQRCLYKIRRVQDRRSLFVEQCRRSTGLLMIWAAGGTLDEVERKEDQIDRGAGIALLGK